MCARPPEAPLAHVGVAVADLDVALRFYREALGWELRHGPRTVVAGPQEHDVLGQGVRTFRQAHVAAPGGGALLELFEFRAPHRPGDRWRPGPFHLCVVDPDAGGRIAAIERAGGRQLSALWPHRPGARTALCYCAAPDGHLVEVATHDDARVYR
ncbi:MAG TPA: VOC family protein [Solirubrobacter sp.]|nr:VOC family protein [Solirubrobacter sp.]